MRQRSGKGLIFAFDAALETRIEDFKRANGYYPALKVIGASFDPPHTPSFIFRSLRRLSDAGRLTDEAEQVYDSKNKKEKQAHGEEKGCKGKTVKQVKKARRA